MISAILAAIIFQAQQGAIEFKVESENARVDPAESVFLRLELVAPAGSGARLPDLRSRVNGFSLAEDFTEDPVKCDDGREKLSANWRLVPQPYSDVYRVRPFAVGPIVCGPIYFEPPQEREAVTGEMEVEIKKDFPPLSWRLVAAAALALAAVSGLAFLLVKLVRYLARKVREHRMSPIERAWVELDRLIKKGLPGRGRYKDFYIELTMVVRRYIQRKYGIRAPHMTTEEFLQTASPSDELKRFLESADMVKFAGVEATPEMADEAVDCARGYLKSDSSVAEGRRQ